MSKGLIGSYSNAKNKANIKNEYKNNNPREIYIDKTVLNLFCTKKNINGIKVDKYTIKWVRSFRNKEINKKLDTIKNAWANIDEDLYNTIQNFAT